MIKSKFPLLVLMLALWCSIGLAATAAALNVGDAAPNVTLPTSAATPATAIDFGKLKGKIVYVDFWASWCGPCKQSFPWMNDMHTKYGPQGLQIVAINVDAKAADAERFLATSSAKFIVAFDAKGETPKQFGVKSMPTSFLVNSDGKIMLVHSGFRDADRAQLEAAIVGALAQEQVKK